MTKMQEAAAQEGKDYKIWAVDVDSVEFEEGYDVVLLGPQVSNRMEEVLDAVGEDRIPVKVIDRDAYGKCNGAAVVRMAEELMQNKS